MPSWGPAWPKLAMPWAGCCLDMTKSPRDPSIQIKPIMDHRMGKKMGHDMEARAI